MTYTCIDNTTYFVQIKTNILGDTRIIGNAAFPILAKMLQQSSTFVHHLQTVINWFSSVLSRNTIIKYWKKLIEYGYVRQRTNNPRDGYDVYADPLIECISETIPSYPIVDNSAQNDKSLTCGVQNLDATCQILTRTVQNVDSNHNHIYNKIKNNKINQSKTIVEENFSDNVNDEIVEPDDEQMEKFNIIKSAGVFVDDIINARLKEWSVDELKHNIKVLQERARDGLCRSVSAVLAQAIRQSNHYYRAAAEDIAKRAFAVRNQETYKNSYAVANSFADMMYHFTQNPDWKCPESYMVTGIIMTPAGMMRIERALSYAEETGLSASEANAIRTKLSAVKVAS